MHVSLLSEHCVHFMVHWCLIWVNMYTQWAWDSPTKRRDEARTLVYFPCSSFVCISQAHIWKNMLCISRCVYDVNITVHLLLLNTFRVCSSITLSVLIRENDLKKLSLSFTLTFSRFSEEIVSSCGFIVFTIACRIQQISTTKWR